MWRQTVTAAVCCVPARDHVAPDGLFLRAGRVHVRDHVAPDGR